jgi:precorrin-6A synthase
VRRLLLIGIGAGHPDHVTVQALAALDAFDVLFVVEKAAAEELVALRRRVVARHRTAGPYRTVELQDPPRPWRSAPDYRAAVARWRAQRTAQWEAALRDELADGETGAFLVWGDPSLYESTLAIAREIADRGAVPGLALEVIPGISSVQVLAARHRIPLNRVGRPVLITPARLLGDGLPDADDVVVMLDPGTAFAELDPAGLEIYWGAYLGTDDELLIAGPLAEVAEEIVATRARARAEKGWVFDVYLLRRTG